MSSLIIVVAVGVFVASLVALGASVFMPSDEATATEERLLQLSQNKRGLTKESAASSLLLDDSKDGKDALSEFIRRIPAISKYIDQAGLKWTVSQFLMMCGGGFVIGIFICVVTPIPVLIGPILGLLLASFPLAFVMFKRGKRMTKFGKQLPEALELLSRSLRAGHSLQAGFGLVGEETEAPLGPEFRRCYEEQKFGIPIDESIEDMTQRIPNMDLRFFATAVLLQRQTGGDLGEILDKIGHLIRERLQIQGQIQALTGEGRMSGAVLLSLPPLLFLVMLKLNYPYIITLFTDPIGNYLLGIALVTQFIGALVIKKIITIKV